eukprot:COSAG05_NODE_378_length_10601_cov_10.955437_4_plen_355_part_00
MSGKSNAGNTPSIITFGEGDGDGATPSGWTGDDSPAAGAATPGTPGSKPRRRRPSMTGGGADDGGDAPRRNRRLSITGGDGGRRRRLSITSGGGGGGGEDGADGNLGSRRNRRLSITDGGSGRRRRLSITGGSSDASMSGSRRNRRLSITGASGLDADALAAVQMEEEQKALQAATGALAELAVQRQKRMDVVVSQILSVVVASLFGLLENAISCHHTGSGVYHRRCLRVIELTGKYLVHVESLLSTWKNEKGMLLDLHFAVWHGLNNTILRCVDASTMTGPASRPNRCISVDKSKDGDTQSFIVNLSLSTRCFALLPGSAQADGTTVDIPVAAVLFTQVRVSVPNPPRALHGQ